MLDGRSHDRGQNILFSHMFTLLSALVGATGQASFKGKKFTSAVEIYNVLIGDSTIVKSQSSNWRTMICALNNGNIILSR